MYKSPQRGVSRPILVMTTVEIQKTMCSSGVVHSQSNRLLSAINAIAALSMVMLSSYNVLIVVT